MYEHRTELMSRRAPRPRPFPRPKFRLLAIADLKRSDRRGDRGGAGGNESDTSTGSIRLDVAANNRRSLAGMNLAGAFCT